MTTPHAPNPGGQPGRRIGRTAQVIIVGSVMFTFISYWRTAAIVLCDMASTAYYIGGIVEQAIGPAAPWFILAVMLFSYSVRWVYIESCTLFVRGGVYRVVKNAMGGFLAKFAVSALLFDYILTGPTSVVSAGQYVIGLALDSLALLRPEWKVADGTAREELMRWGSVVIGCLVTYYFYRENVRGIHESSDKAVKIMLLTTVMMVIMLIWCGITLVVRWDEVRFPTWRPNLEKKVEFAEVKYTDPVTREEHEKWVKGPDGQLQPRLDENGRPVSKLNPVTGNQEDPLGFIPSLFPSLAESLRQPGNWFSIIGVIGLLLAFGHSVLAMSGEETLAQVYREVESPKLPNFQKAAFIVFVYSLMLTATMSFLAVLLIPDEVRMKDYKDNLIGGLAMYVVGPPMLKLFLQGFVVIVGFFILSGAVNTSIIGSNGVLNRVSEDGVLPDWFLKPHEKYGTTYRLLRLIVALQLTAILVSRGDMYFLGEAYAFGVVWSFVFQALSMMVLRFKDRRPRDFKVPLNVKVGGVEVPVGLGIIFVILLCTAVGNFLTKEVATVGGLTFTAIFFSIFWASEHYHERKRRGHKHEHLEQFHRETADQVNPAQLGISHQYRKLVAIRSPHNLYMLEKALAETDPDTTDVVVMTAKVVPPGHDPGEEIALDDYDQHLMTAVVTVAEKAGKEVRPVILPTNNPLFAILRTAKEIGAQEIIVGASNKFNAQEQLDQMTFYWMQLHPDEAPPLTIRILSRTWDVHSDFRGGNRIPKLSERKARSVAELRAAGVGVDRVLLVHHGTAESSDLFKSVLTFLDPAVGLTVVEVRLEAAGANGENYLTADQVQATKLHREIDLQTLTGEPGPALVAFAAEHNHDLIILPTPPEQRLDGDRPLAPFIQYVVRHAPCQVCLVAPRSLPQEPVEQPAPPA